MPQAQIIENAVELQNLTVCLYIRTALENYYAVDGSPASDTFLATPSTPRNGMYRKPATTVFKCPYIVESCQREIMVAA